MAATNTDVVEVIKSIKKEGNLYFGQKHYESAINYYTKGIEHNVYQSEAEQDNVSLIELRQSLLLNRAKCHFQLKNLKDALIDSSNCIKTCDETRLSFKAHYTRSEIYLHLNDYKSAIKHCDIILNAPSSLSITSLQQRTKKLKRQIKEKSMFQSSLAQNKHRSRRANKIVNAMILKMEQHRSRIEFLQKQTSMNTKDDIAFIISSKWWRKWYKLDGSKTLNEVDVSILMVDNSDLMKEFETKQEEKEEEIIINIESPYLKYNLRENLEYGADKDYMILYFKSYQEMIKMGYKLEPTIFAKKIDSYKNNKEYELYKSKFSIHFAADDRVVTLLCSMNATIRKLCTQIARHFVMQSSSIRLRYDSMILDRSHTLAQHQVANEAILYVEIRLPNGCWPIANVDSDDNKLIVNQKNECVLCQSCQRLITHFVNCKRQECNAKYCNNKHLRAHYNKYHEAEHRVVNVMNKDDDAHHGRWGICGLQNLGNTCYINASLQCLSFIAELRCYLTSDDYFDDINADSALGFKGELAKTFASFLKQMWFGSATVVCPTAIRGKIGSLHTDWKSSQQQDAEEFIRWLLDGLHEDLNLIKKKPYYVLPDSDNRDECLVANEHWTLHLKRNQSVIVDIFQGQYKSTLECPQSSCNHKSLKFDAFSALSVPIPDKHTQIAVECVVFSSKHKSYEPYKLTVNVSAKAVVTQLTANLMEKLGSKYLDENDEKQQLLVCKITHNKFGKYWSSSRPIKKVMHSQHIAYVYQVSHTTIAQRKSHNSIQIRMNFCYRHNLSQFSHSSGDSSDDFNNNNNKKNKNKNKLNNNRIYFAHPLVTDMKCCQFSGNAIYRVFAERFASIIILDGIPCIKMYIKQESGEECELLQNSHDVINVAQYTNKQRSVATIEIELSYSEYKFYIDPRAALDELSFDKLSDVKPKNYIDIYDCLKLYTAAEVLDDVLWKCSKCHRENIQPSKQLHLWRLPQILIIHLKRFLNQKGYFGGVGKKNTLNVIAPINGLDLTDFVARSDIVPKYDLFATLNHHGIMEFGHYYCCVRTDETTQITNYYQYHENENENDRDADETKAKWTLFNDEQVHNINTEKVQEYMKDAYLLFYRRRDRV